MSRLRSRCTAGEPITRIAAAIAIAASVFALFAIVLLWTTNVALAIERWRIRSGSRSTSSARAVVR